MWELQWVLKGFGQFGRKVTNRGLAVYNVKPISASGQGNPPGLKIIQTQIRKDDRISYRGQQGEITYVKWSKEMTIPNQKVKRRLQKIREKQHTVGFFLF